MAKLNWDKTPNDKLSELGLKPKAYVVLVWLIKYQTYASAMGADWFYLNQSDLAEKLHISRMTVYRILQLFIEKGYVACIPQEPKEGKKHSGKVNYYMVADWLMELK